MIVGLFPELLSAGGVQRASRHTAAVLADFARQRSIPYRFLSLNDPQGSHRLQVGGSEFVFSGYRRVKVSFLSEALRAAHQCPQLVVAGHPHLALVTCPMKLRSSRLQAVVLAHGIEVWSSLSRLRRWALQRADLVLAPSKDTARQLVAKQGVSSHRIRQLPWALDPEFNAMASTPETSPGQKHLPPGFPKGRVVLTVGRWSAAEGYKGLDNLIAAMPRLLAAGTDLYLVAVGEGDDRGRLERFTHELAVADRVRFLGWLTPQELVTCYQCCEVFALPSGGEGFGMVFLEAMALGKPVVGGAHGGTPEIIQDGVTGLLVPHGDIDRLCVALRALLEDHQLRKNMGLRARERVLQSYLFHDFAARLSEILATTCES